MNYIEACDSDSDIRELIDTLAAHGVTDVHFCDPCDDWLEQRLRSSAKHKGVNCHEYPSLSFLNSKTDLNHFFKPNKKKFFQTSFYKQQRIARGILIEQGEKAGWG